MKKSDRILREVLQHVFVGGDRFFKQKKLAETCDLSLGTINPLVQKLRRLGILERKPQGFRVVDADRLLTYWSVTRDLYKDISFATYVPRKASEIEPDLPEEVIFTGYSGYAKHFGSLPSDYDEVHIYTKPQKIKRRFRSREDENPNLFVLDPDDHLKNMSANGVVPLPQLYVDLWQLGRGAGKFEKDLRSKLEQKLFGGLERSFAESLAR